MRDGLVDLELGTGAAWDLAHEREQRHAVLVLAERERNVVPWADADEAGALLVIPVVEACVASGGVRAELLQVEGCGRRPGQQKDS